MAPISRSATYTETVPPQETEPLSVRAQQPVSGCQLSTPHPRELPNQATLGPPTGTRKGKHGDCCFEQHNNGAPTNTQGTTATERAYTEHGLMRSHLHDRHSTALQAPVGAIAGGGAARGVPRERLPLHRLKHTHRNAPNLSGRKETSLHTAVCTLATVACAARLSCQHIQHHAPGLNTESERAES